MRKFFKNIFILLVVLVGGTLLIKKFKLLPNLNNLFAPSPVVLDETPILIKEIKSIAQLVTVTAFDEVVIDSSVVTRSSALINSFNSIARVPIIPSFDKRLVLIV